MLKFICAFLLLFCFSLGLRAQDKKEVTPKGRNVATTIKTFDAKVKVIGVLQGTKDLAVIQIIEVDPNEHNLSVGDEVLCKFYFGTKPYKGERLYPGVKGGEILTAEIHAMPNDNNVQVNYRILRYDIVGSFEVIKKKKKKE